jgi:hypothetical protein
MNEEITNLVKAKYGFGIVKTEPTFSYFPSVWEITTDQDQTIILKKLPDFYKGNIFSYQAVLALCEIINSEFSNLKTIIHIKDLQGEIVQERYPHLVRQFIQDSLSKICQKEF